MSTKAASRSICKVPAHTAPGSSKCRRAQTAARTPTMANTEKYFRRPGRNASTNSSTPAVMVRMISGAIAMRSA